MSDPGFKSTGRFSSLGLALAILGGKMKSEVWKPSKSESKEALFESTLRLSCIGEIEKINFHIYNFQSKDG